MGAMKGMKQVTLYLHPEVHKKLKVISARMDVPIYEIVDRVVRAALKKKEIPDGHDEGSKPSTSAPTRRDARGAKRSSGRRSTGS